MIGRMVRRFLRVRDGSTAIEFAMTATALLAFMIGILQGGLLYWTWQALQGAAIDAARCAAINSTSCANVASSTAATQSYAATAAQTRGVSAVTSSMVSVATGTATSIGCGTNSSSVVQVTISYPFGIIFLWRFSPTVTVRACFPLAS
jgi:Flp pilus assembly protein TadG